MNIPVRTPCDAAPATQARDCQGFAAPARRWTLLAAILGSGMAFMDGSVVNVALPAIQHDLRASASQMQWVVEAYALVLSALLLVGGALGDRLGRRAMFMTGTAIFTIASLACALSPSAAWLIAARTVQGLGAALLVPGSLALIGAAYPQADRGAAIGTWSAMSGVAAAIGPVLGGWLVEHYHWTWAFSINLPLGAALWLMCAWCVPESRAAAGDAAIDARGAVLATLGLAGVTFGLIQAPSHGWRSADVAGSLAGGAACLLLFVLAERKTAAPMVPLQLFANREFSGANLLTLLLYAGLGGGLYFLPLNLIQVQGYGAASAGAAMLPFIALMFALSRWSGRVVDRFGARVPLILGPCVAAVGFGLFVLPGIGGSYWLTFFPAIVVLGLGMAVTVAPLTTTVMNAVAAEQSGVASGVNNAVSRVAGLLAIAAFGIMLSHVFNDRLADGLAAARLPAPLHDAVFEQRDRLAGIVIPQTAAPDDGLRAHRAVAEAFVAGFRWVMGVCALLALAAGMAAAWLVRSKSLPSAKAEVIGGSRPD